MRRSIPVQFPSFVESKERLRAALDVFEASVDNADPTAALDEVLAVHQAVKETASRLIEKQTVFKAQPEVPSDSAASESPGLTYYPERFSRVRSKVTQNSEFKILAVRVPLFLDRYVAAWVSRSKEGTDRRNEFTKQEVVTEALCLFYATHPLPVVPDEPGM